MPKEFSTFEECETWIHQHLADNGDLDEIIQDLKNFKSSTVAYRL